MNWPNKKIFITYAIIYFIGPLLILEFIFRLLPVSDSLTVNNVNDQNPILHFQPSRKVNIQTGFNFSHFNTKNINNYGYASDNDFLKGGDLEKKTIVVVGDSYVEALQVSNPNSFHGNLATKRKDLAIYPIGISGAPLSQYLAFAAFAEAEFSPDAYVFVIVANDFHQSWEKNKKAPGFHYFLDTGMLKRIDYERSFFKKLTGNSAFLRYLFLDLKIPTQFLIMKNKIFNLNEPSFTNNNEILSDGMLAIQHFFNNLEQFFSDKPVILILDGDRRSIHKNVFERPKDINENIWFNEMIKQSYEHSFITLIDLHSIFFNEWKVNKSHFNSTYDYHWNEKGHSVVSKVLDNHIDKVFNKES